MFKCFSFSFTASRTRCLRSTFHNSGLKPTTTILSNNTTMFCWIPTNPNPTRPNLLLIHGFGASSTWQFSNTVRSLSQHFNIYVPDLVFFGDSFSTETDRTESLNARCCMQVLEANSVEKVVVLGVSYGGFVAYSMAAQFKECVERVVICCAGVCLEEKDLKEGLFPVANVDEAAEILVPRTVENMRRLVRFTFVKPPWILPSCFINDFIDEMCSQHVEEKRDLIRSIAKDRKLSDLPKISQVLQQNASFLPFISGEMFHSQGQKKDAGRRKSEYTKQHLTLARPTLIVWGDQDRIFPVELAYRLQRHLGENAELAVIKNTGHAFMYEKSKEFDSHLKKFLLNPISSNSITPVN